jgi:peroxiredoxin Q/BCP
MIRSRLAFSALLLTVPFALQTVLASETMPQAGQEAPVFTLPSQDGTNISLADFRGKWVVLYFYPILSERRHAGLHDRSTQFPTRLVEI